MRPLGTKQTRALAALARHHSYHPGCGWTMGTHSNTVKILESLAARGLVTKKEKPGFDTYTLTN